MATASDIISAARYDLGDYQTGLVWDDTELLEYLNRMVNVMNSELAALDSDLVEAEERDTDCVANSAEIDASAINSDLWTKINSVWLGTTRLIQLPLAQMRYKRALRRPNYSTWVTSTSYSVGDHVENSSIPYECDEAHTSGTFATDLAAGKWSTDYSTGKPSYWALRERKILFEVECASAYTDLLIYYTTKEATLTTSSNMPYDDIFNDSFIEALVLYAMSKKEGNISQINGVNRAMFHKRAMEETIRRNFVPRSYYIDF